jgi:hypothetical protein
VSSCESEARCVSVADTSLSLSLSSWHLLGDRPSCSAENGALHGSLAGIRRARSRGLSCSRCEVCSSVALPASFVGWRAFEQAPLRVPTRAGFEEVPACAPTHAGLIGPTRRGPAPNPGPRRTLFTAVGRVR